MELGEIVVAEHPGEKQLYTEQKSNTKDLLGRRGNLLYQVFGYLTGEMKECGEWMKSKYRDVAGAFWVGRSSW